MLSDPIVEEVRNIRQEHAKRFDYDIKAIVADIRKQEKQHADRMTSFPPKPPRKKRNA